MATWPIGTLPSYLHIYLGRKSNLDAGRQKEELGMISTVLDAEGV